MANLDVTAETDGRKQRTSSSRLKIVNAMLQLIREGNLSPSAEQVAETAGVGLRTVFRRFNEMELLFRELSNEIVRIVGPELNNPLEGEEWQEKLDNLIERNLKIFQVILPYRTAAGYHKHRSQFIRDDLAYWAKVEKKLLISILPFSEKDNALLIQSLTGCISFDYWMSLIITQGLSNKQASTVIHNTVNALLKNCNNPT